MCVIHQFVEGKGVGVLNCFFAEEWRPLQQASESGKKKVALKQQQQLNEDMTTIGIAIMICSL